MRWPLLALTLALPLAAAEPARQLVVLKADDFRADGRWQAFTGYVVAQDVRASLGIIGNVLEGDTSRIEAYVKALQATGRFDFWHHGYDHKLNYQEDGQTVCEFRGRSREAQAASYQRAFELAERKLGIRFSIFGAPGNAVDAATAEVLAARPELDATFFGPANVPGKLTLERWINAEQPTLVPNFDAFSKAFPTRAEKPYLVLQFHPGNWDETRFEQFRRILAFLKAQPTVEIVTAGELVQRLRAAAQ
ncbi:MAG: hypothetical protein IT204_05820 [Fimbriimonadaceae bacterium]|nr:hypothetical protein [Fimbriimonadaceae bacterium]